MELPRKIYWMLVKDLRIEARRGFEILASIGFISAASLIIAQAASRALTPQLVIPALWITMVFIAVFTSTVSFTREADKKTLPGLKLIPASPASVFLAKTIFTLILIVMQGGVVLVLLAVFSGQLYLLSWKVVLTFLVLSVHISAVAAFTSAIVMYSEGRAFLIPMLIFVLTFPVIPLATTLAHPSLPAEASDIAMLVLETLIVLVTTTTLSEYILRA